MHNPFLRKDPISHLIQDPFLSFFTHNRSLIYLLLSIGILLDYDGSWTQSYILALTGLGLIYYWGIIG